MSLSLHRYAFRALGGPNEVQLYAETEAAAELVFQAIEAEVRRIEKKFSRYDSESVVSRINAAAGLAAVEIDAETAALLEYSALAYQQSEGLFDITSGILRRVWQYERAELPAQTAIDELLPLIGFEKTERTPNTFYLPQAGMQIDFGGVGKEYAVDRAAQVAAERGAHHLLINLAGDVRALGPQANGSPWRLGIRHPREEHGVLTAVELFEGAMASSGDYERFIEVEGRRYSHILNPKTGWPVSGLQAVTVLAETCALAGTLATEAMLLPEERAKKRLRRHGVAHLYVCSNGELQLSKELRRSAISNS